MKGELSPLLVQFECNTREEMIKTDTVAELINGTRVPVPGGLEEINELQLSRRAGRLEETALPKTFEGEAVVFIPAYERYVENNNLGTLIQLVRDISEASVREGIPVSIIISDDTATLKDPDKNVEDFSGERLDQLRARLLDLAFDSSSTMKETPPIYWVGRAQREAMLEGSESYFKAAIAKELEKDGVNDASEIDRHFKTAQHLMTWGGYGPQRVRGQAMTFGSEQPIISRDSDLILVHGEATSGMKSAVAGTHDQGFGFIFSARQEKHITVNSDPDHAFLGHIKNSGIGQALGDIQKKYPGVVVYEGLEVTKDKGLNDAIADPKKPAAFHLSATKKAPEVDLDAVVRMVMGHKWGTPDVNGFNALLSKILTGETRLAAVALPAEMKGTRAGEFSGLVVESTTNPDCAVETDMAREPRDVVPWLVTEPKIGGEGQVLLDTGARAEDQLRANNPDPLMLITYSNEMVYHSRSDQGRQEREVETFLSEDLGDMLAAIVRAGLSYDSVRECYRFAMPELRKRDDVEFAEPGKVLNGELLKMIDHMWHNRVQVIREAIDREISESPLRADLGPLRETLNRRCSTDKRVFEQRVLDYLAKQVNFVDSVIRVYPAVMDCCQNLRSQGKFPALRYVG